MCFSTFLTSHCQAQKSFFFLKMHLFLFSPKGVEILKIRNFFLCYNRNVTPAVGRTCFGNLRRKVFMLSCDDKIRAEKITHSVQVGTSLFFLGQITLKLPKPQLRKSTYGALTIGATFSKLSLQLHVFLGVFIVYSPIQDESNFRACSFELKPGLALSPI